MIRTQYRRAHRHPLAMWHPPSEKKSSPSRRPKGVLAGLPSAMPIQSRHRGARCRSHACEAHGLHAVVHVVHLERDLVDPVAARLDCANHPRELVPDQPLVHQPLTERLPCPNQSTMSFSVGVKDSIKLVPRTRSWGLHSLSRNGLRLPSAAEPNIESLQQNTFSHHSHSISCHSNILVVIPTVLVVTATVLVVTATY